MSGPYRLQRSILSSQTVYTPVQMKNNNILIDLSTIVVIQKKKIDEFTLVKIGNTNILVQLYYKYILYYQKLILDDVYFI